MAEAEYLLPARRRNTESVLSIPVNGEERVPSPLPAEKPQKPPSFSVDAGQPPSPSMAQNGHEPHLIKNSAALQPNKSKACKKKKKCLSDIFGHIVGGSNESSVITKVVDPIHTPTSALKEEPEDSPYADLDSVPLLHRPKRTAVTPVQVVDRPLRKEQAKTKYTGKVHHSPDSPGVLITKTTKDTNSDQSLGSCNELSSSTKKHSVNLPASSRLMTRALKAEEETDLRDTLATSRVSTDVPPKDRPDTPSGVSIKTEMSLNWELPGIVSSSANHCSPKRRARKPDKKQIRNGSFLEPKFVRSGLPAEQSVKIKTENVTDLSPSSSSPSSSLSPMDAFQDPKELMFRSLVKEDSSESESTVFRPDSNYKFSTFLMLLKDMHDTREKEGKPLTVPPSPVLIKEEPLVIPASTAGELGSCDGFTRRVKTESGPSGRAAAFKNRAWKTKNRTKAIMTADTYHFADFPISSQSGNSDKQRRKQRIPAKLKPSIPGLSSDIADLAYGREFVSGHADLAELGSCPPVAAGPSAGYLDKNPGSTVAPKKRWQLAEEDAESKGGVMREVSPDMMNGSYSSTLSPDFDLGVERQAENDLFFSEKGSTAGKIQTPELGSLTGRRVFVRLLLVLL